MSEQLVSRPGHSGGNPQTQDPTTTLKHALAAFKSVLTEEQQQEFLASNDKPDITSVISFVAEIDANNSSTARRCVAPRLYTFLESTQQFTAIVDTFVSSNPQIAALVWGGVKFAILSASNVSSYFEKFTSMIMQIGKTCPKYQQFGQLYPGCVGLQRELCKYYATIVHLCIKVVEICQRPTVLQIFSSVFNPFESEFQPFLSQLEHTITSVRLEISLAANQAIQEMRNLVEYESRNSTSFRRLALKFNERSQKAEAEAKEWRLNKLERENSELRSTIKDNLSNFDFATPWKLALSQRVPFTAEWLQQEAMFSEWRYLPQSSILWCPGKMGVGKTVMMSNVVTHLHSSRKPDDVISYSFCSAEYLVSLSARNVFGVFARQLLESQIEIADNKKLQELESLTRNIDTAQIIDLLLSYLEPSKQYFLVLDGVDEFESDELNDLKSGLANLCSSQNQAFKLICTGQFELESKLFDSKTPKLTIPINGSKVDLDIDQYIRTIIHEEKKLKLRDHGLITKIFDALHEGSNGM
jgi:Cdc6-like AAA superfamily ATPase